MQWQMLLAASLFLYYTIEKGGLVFVLITSLSIYFCAQKMDENNEKYKKSEAKKISKPYLIFGILLNFGLLFGFKYIGLLSKFDFKNINFSNVLMPLGISFYTFKATAYLIDIYRNKFKAEKNFFKFLAFVSYFPAMLQGPIDKYNELSLTLYPEKEFKAENLARGMYLILFGMMKKLLIADKLATPIQNAVDIYTTYQGSVLFFILFIFGFQIYADFSGGIDIVRGISKVLGVDMAENFNSPYFADSVAEYWRRWHMTLGRWMREYVFFPMSLSKLFAKINMKSRRKFGAKYGKITTLLISTLVVYILVGMWHGARPISFMFGLYYGVVISISLVLENFRKEMDKKIKLNPKIKYFFKMLWVWFVVTVGRFFSKADTLTELWEMFSYSVLNFSGENFWKTLAEVLIISKVDYYVIIFAALIVISVGLIREKYQDVYKKITKYNPVFTFVVLTLIIFVTFAFGIARSDFKNVEFIYMKY